MERPGMTSRERVRRALAHEEADRVPLEFGSPNISSLVVGEPHGYRALCEALGITDYPAPELNLYLNSVKNVDPRIMRRFGADLRWVSPATPEVVRRPDGTLVDAWGLVLTPIGTFNIVEDANTPLRGAVTRDDIDTYPLWPDTTDPGISAGKTAEAAAHAAAGYAVVATLGPGGRLFHNYSWLRGFDSWLMDMHDNPALYHALAERILGVGLGYIEAFLPAVADYADLVYFADDLGTQQSLLMSPRQYREFCKPYHRELIAAIRRTAPNATILLHSCGAIAPLIPDLIDIGVQVLNPVQPKAAGMQPLTIKRAFGSTLSFLGGLDIQELLPFGSRDEIRDGVKELMDAYAPGGGYIFGPSHEILPEVSPENIITMYDAALEFGGYARSS